MPKCTETPHHLDSRGEQFSHKLVGLPPQQAHRPMAHKSPVCHQKAVPLTSDYTHALWRWETKQGRRGDISAQAKIPTTGHDPASAPQACQCAPCLGPRICPQLTQPPQQERPRGRAARRPWSSQVKEPSPTNTLSTPSKLVPPTQEKFPHKATPLKTQTPANSHKQTQGIETEKNTEESKCT